MPNVETASVRPMHLGNQKLMPEREPVTQPTANLVPRKSDLLATEDIPTKDLKPQLIDLNEANSDSLNLLDLSGNALLKALEGLVPEGDQPRTVGEIAAAQCTELAKGICEIVKTKVLVVQTMHTIGKDAR